MRCFLEYRAIRALLLCRVDWCRYFQAAELGDALAQAWMSRELMMREILLSGQFCCSGERNGYGEGCESSEELFDDYQSSSMLMQCFKYTDVMSSDS